MGIVVLLEEESAKMLMKIAVFVLVQALVYLILSSSSEIFSKNKLRSLSFKPARSVSIRRMLAVISDMPPGGEASPRTPPLSSSKIKELYTQSPTTGQEDIAEPTITH